MLVAETGTDSFLTYVVAGEVVNLGLGKHGVVLKLGLAERGSVALDRMLVMRPPSLVRNADIPAMMTSLALPERRVLRTDL